MGTDWEYAIRGSIIKLIRGWVRIHSHYTASKHSHASHCEYTLPCTTRRVHTPMHHKASTHSHAPQGEYTLPCTTRRVHTPMHHTASTHSHAPHGENTLPCTTRRVHTPIRERVVTPIHFSRAQDLATHYSQWAEPVQVANTNWVSTGSV